jgi:hypothetical protein
MKLKFFSFEKKLTPKNLVKIQNELNHLSYFLEDDGNVYYPIKSAARTLESSQGGCLEGALAGCFILLEEYDIQPQLLVLTTETKNWHAVSYVVIENKHYSIGHSSNNKLKDRLEGFSCLNELIESYSTILKTRGYTSIKGFLFPLNQSKINWKTSKDFIPQLHVEINEYKKKVFK